MDSVGGDHGVDRDDRRERRRRWGWSEEDLEENDRRTAAIRDLMRQAHDGSARSGGRRDEGTRLRGVPRRIHGRRRGKAQDDALLSLLP
jgi:hypothetical protein